jgi:lipoprotein LprG
MRRRVVPLLLVVALAVAGCGGSSSSDHPDPAAALTSAGQKLAQTSGATLALSTDDLPDGVQGVKTASGTVTNAPAFDGTLGVVTGLGSFSVPVKAVGGKVYAQIPLTPGWAEVDPDDYGAPDPAQLMDDTNGIPAILAATTGAKAGGQVRGGTDNKEVLDTYTGSVPDSAVKKLIPGATGEFDATYSLTSGGELRAARLTGTFQEGQPSMTYALSLTDYGTTKDITAP